MVEAWVVRINESLAPYAQRCSAHSIVEGCPEDGIRFEHHVRSLVSKTGIDCRLGRIFVPGQSSCGGKNTHIICIEQQRSTLNGCLGNGRRRRQPYHMRATSGRLTIQRSYDFMLWSIQSLLGNSGKLCLENVHTWGAGIKFTTESKTPDIRLEAAYRSIDGTPV